MSHPEECNHLVALEGYDTEGISKVLWNEWKPDYFTHIECFQYCAKCGEKLDWNKLQCPVENEGEA